MSTKKKLLVEAEAINKRVVGFLKDARIENMNACAESERALTMDEQPNGEEAARLDYMSYMLNDMIKNPDNFTKDEISEEIEKCKDDLEEMGYKIA